jgi:hypothetical protein
MFADGSRKLLCGKSSSHGGLKAVTFQVATNYPAIRVDQENRWQRVDIKRGCEFRCLVWGHPRLGPGRMVGFKSLSCIRDIRINTDGKKINSGIFGELRLDPLELR